MVETSGGEPELVHCVQGSWDQPTPEVERVCSGPQGLEGQSITILQPTPPRKTWKSRLLMWSRFRPPRQRVRVQFRVFGAIVLVVWSLFASLSVIFRQKPFSGDYW